MNNIDTKEAFLKRLELADKEAEAEFMDMVARDQELTYEDLEAVRYLSDEAREDEAYWARLRAGAA